MRHTPLESVRGARGCTLIEVLVAMAIFMVAAGALAQLAALATRANLQAGRTSLATVIAQQKIEELLCDGALFLDVSPAGALTSSLDGWFDFVDRHGRPTGAGASPPAGTDYLRRWSIEPLTDSETLIVQVAVTDIKAASSDAAPVSSPRVAQVRLVAAKGRQGF